MRRLAGLRNYGLSIVFGLLLLAALTGQAFTGMAGVNERALDTGLPEVSIGAYLTSSEFAVDVAENWQSEYLQFFLYILLTVWLLQRGSPESKALDRAGRESDKDQLVGEYATADSPAWARASGWRRALFSSSLGLVMGFFFLLSWTAQFIAGRSAYNAGQLVDLQAPVSWSDYLVAPTSGTAPCRTGSPSSSPWAAWSSSASTCESADPPSPSGSGLRTRRPPSRTEGATPRPAPRLLRTEAFGGCATRSSRRSTSDGAVDARTDSGS